MLRVACITDEFTHKCLAPECTLFPLTPENWRAVFADNNIDLLFVESAWCWAA